MEAQKRCSAGYLARILIPLCLLLSPVYADSLEKKENGVIWKVWGDPVFEHAKAEKKLVLLNLKAAWCHWCHVMDEKTYSDPEVVGLLQKSFISVAVQQDDHPALSSRYKEYGWPATVILNGMAEEVEILSGYIEPEEFKTTLRRVIARPSVRKENSAKPLQKVENRSLQNALLERFQRSLDHTLGGLRTSHRYLDSDSLEFAFREGMRGDSASAKWFHTTLAANRALIDPVWGGVYQYSTGSTWSNPHFEKLISSQAISMFLYSLGVYSETHNLSYRDDATDVLRYVKTFLSSPLGGFYVSQSAVVDGIEDNATYFKLSDEKRREMGFPKVDTHEYARETALGIEILLYAYRMFGDASLLSDAFRSARWLIDNRVRSDGFVAHDVGRKYEFFLADSVATAKSFLHLYSVTGDPYWLQKGELVASRIIESFPSSDGVGFLSTSVTRELGHYEQALLRHVSLSENLAVGRVLNLYSHYSGNKRFRDAAQSAQLAVSQPKLAFSTISEPGILLLSEELSRAPLHVTLIGDAADSRTEELWKVILAIPDFYTQVERYSLEQVAKLGDSRERIRYPKVNQPAVFLCANKTCSLPIFTPDEVRATVYAAMKNSKRER